MAKLTQQQSSQQREIAELLAKPRDLTYDETIFVLKNYAPPANVVTDEAAFFTPPSLADMAAMQIGDSVDVVDLGAGIGTLSWFLTQQWGWNKELLCVEKNPDFVKIGKKLVPQAQWVEGDIFDKQLWSSLPKMEFFITNPPFGIPVKQPWLAFSGDSLVAAIEVGLRVTSDQGGTAILPSSQCPFKYSRPLKRLVRVQRRAVEKKTVYEHCSCCNQRRVVEKGTWKTEERITTAPRYDEEEIEFVGMTDESQYEARAPLGEMQRLMNLFPDMWLHASGVNTCALEGFSDTNIITEIVNVEMQEPLFAITKSGQARAF